MWAFFFFDFLVLKKGLSDDYWKAEARNPMMDRIGLADNPLDGVLPVGRVCVPSLLLFPYFCFLKIFIGDNRLAYIIKLIST